MSLNLFGLADDTPDYSLYLCVKELFENAVAACDGGGEHNIRVSVRGLPGVPHLYRVCVGDDGSGFDSQSLAARSLGLVTGSTAGSPSPFDPGASDDPSSARGLTMVLFWANRSYWSRAETGRADDHPSPQAIADITSFSAGFMRKHVWSVDAAGPPTLSTVIVPMGGDTKVTGTQVSAVLLGAAQALCLIYQYIECAQALCTSSHLSVHIDLSESDGPNGAAPLWAGVGSLAVESTSISRMFLQGSTSQALPGVECLLEKLAAGLVDEGGEPQGGGAASSSADRVVLQRGVGCGVLGGQGFAHASVQLAIEPTADEGLVDLTTAAVASASRSRSRSSVRVGSSPLHIILFVNNKRVDESGCLALNCACWDAVARAKAWKAAGVTVFAGDAAGAQLCIHAARHSFRSAWLVLHVRAGAIAFSDHGKTCLRPLKGLPAAINSALSLALSQVCAGLASRGVFLALSDQNERKIQACASHLATALASILNGAAARAASCDADQGGCAPSAEGEEAATPAELQEHILRTCFLGRR